MRAQTQCAVKFSKSLLGTFTRFIAYYHLHICLRRLSLNVITFLNNEDRKSNSENLDPEDDRTAISRQLILAKAVLPFLH